MREDIPSPELQDLYPVPGDGRVPHGWLRSIDRACTLWLLERGLLDSLEEDRVDTTGAPSEEDEEEAAIAPMAMESADGPDAAAVSAEIAAAEARPRDEDAAGNAPGEFPAEGGSML